MPDHTPIANSLVTSLSILGGGQDTEHTHTDVRTHGQLAILSLAGSQNLCQTKMRPRDPWT